MFQQSSLLVSESRDTESRQPVDEVGHVRTRRHQHHDVPWLDRLGRRQFEPAVISSRIVHAHRGAIHQSADAGGDQLVLEVHRSRPLAEVERIDGHGQVLGRIARRPT